MLYSAGPPSCGFVSGGPGFGPVGFSNTIKCDVLALYPGLVGETPPSLKIADHCETHHIRIFVGLNLFDFVLFSGRYTVGMIFSDHSTMQAPFLLWSLQSIFVHLQSASVG